MVVEAGLWYWFVCMYASTEYDARDGSVEPLSLNSGIIFHDDVNHDVTSSSTLVLVSRLDS